MKEHRRSDMTGVMPKSSPSLSQGWTVCISCCWRNYTSSKDPHPTPASNDAYLMAHNRLGAMPASKYKPPYTFSVTIGEYCTRQMRTFQDLAEKPKMPVEYLMRQANGHAPPFKALVKILAKELGIDESCRKSSRRQ